MIDLDGVPLTVWIGHDAREQAAYDVCEFSLIRRTSIPIQCAPVSATACRAIGFDRPWDVVDGQRIDRRDGKPFSTDFSFARFCVPFLTSRSPWVVFCDCDFLWRADIAQLLAEVDPAKAVSVVQHDHVAHERTKMDGQLQTNYQRKNWSSLIVWNLVHPAHKRLTLADVNTRPGSWLHAFGWLEGVEIGALDPAWNWLEGGGSSVQAGVADPKAVHHTRGSPCLPGWEDVAFADEWRAERAVLQALKETRPSLQPRVR